MISLAIDTPEKAARAVELVRRFSGLEVYASTTVLKERARQAIREVLQARREAARTLQEELRVSVAMGANAAVPPTSSQEEGDENEAVKDQQTPETVS